VVYKRVQMRLYDVTIQCAAMAFRTAGPVRRASPETAVVMPDAAEAAAMRAEVDATMQALGAAYVDAWTLETDADQTENAATSKVEVTGAHWAGATMHGTSSDGGALLLECALSVTLPDACDAPQLVAAFFTRLREDARLGMRLVHVHPGAPAGRFYVVMPLVAAVM